MGIKMRFFLLSFVSARSCFQANEAAVGNACDGNAVCAMRRSLTGGDLKRDKCGLEQCQEGGQCSYSSRSTCVGDSACGRRVVLDEGEDFDSLDDLEDLEGGDIGWQG